MPFKFNLVTCGCGHSFGTSGSRVNYCTKCGSTTNIKNVTGFENAEKLSVAVSTANIPKEISDELIETFKIIIWIMVMFFFKFKFFIS